MASTYFTRTPASDGNRRVFTLSTWVKRGTLGSSQTLFGAHPTNVDVIDFEAGNTLRVYIYNNTTSTIRVPSQLFRDTSAWYHLVFAFDTTNATAQNRCRVYVNGTEVTSWSTNNTIDQNVYTGFNQNVTQYIGRYASGAHLDGLMANIYMIDGQQLDASSFGETDATTGIWKPKPYSGTYGTNGFFLKFENSGSLGLDSSGNGNNFTVNGTPTQTVDTPSNVFATLNPISNNTSGIFLYGNLYYDGNNTDNWSKSISATLAVSKGKWYWEAKATSATDADYQQIGVAKVDKLAGNTTNLYQADFANVVQLHPSTPTVFKAVGSNYYLNSGLTTNDTVMMALDTDNGKMWVGKNGSWFANSSGSTGSPNAGTHPVWDTAEFTVGETYVPVVINYYAAKMTFNFGSGYFNTTAISSPYSDGAGLGKFQYQPPTGYYALCTKNINVYG